MTELNEVIEKLLQGQRRYVARAVSLVEAGGEQADVLLEHIYCHTGKARRIGITGPPGAGKSTLTAELARLLSAAGHRVAIVAVDPSSPFTRGAVLGDRIRMPEIGQHEGVFIRSMASRGYSGGLSAKTADAVDVFDAAGFDYIFVESVGVGQVELQIEKMVDSTVVVLVPESGDQVQAIKAGLMEIADIYVLNKADRPGSNAILQALAAALSFKGRHNHDWDIEIVATVASKAEGMDALLQSFTKHQQFLAQEQRLLHKRAERFAERIKNKADELLQNSLWNEGRKQLLKEAVAGMEEGKVTPNGVARALLQDYLGEAIAAAKEK